MPIYVKASRRARAYQRPDKGNRQQRLNAVEAKLSRHLTAKKRSALRFNEIRETRRRVQRMRARQIMFGF